MEAPLELEAPAFHLIKLFDKIKRIHDNAIADYAMLSIVQDTTRNEVQNIFLVAHYHSVASVRASLETNYNIRFLGEEINNLAFSFIAPLGSNQYCIHGIFLFDF
jgi:hypothetical protein